MKRPLLFPAVMIFLSSCTQYQYLTVSGENISKNEKNEFVSENDTLKVQYSFADYNGKVGITLYNKSAGPLEVDWKKSALIVDGKAYSYYNPNAVIAATVEDSLNRRTAGLGNPRYLASVSGSVLIDEPLQFIPPASSIYKEPLLLPVNGIDNLPEQDLKKESIQSAEYSDGAVSISYKKARFAKDSSPLHFRSYLTLRAGSGGSQKEFTLEHSFYVSEVWKTASAPDDFPAEAVKRSDRFYLAH